MLVSVLLLRCNVWVEPGGDLLLCVVNRRTTVKSDSFNELASRDKLARVRVRMEPPLRAMTWRGVILVIAPHKVLAVRAPGFGKRLVRRNASVDPSWCSLADRCEAWYVQSCFCKRPAAQGHVGGGGGGVLPLGHARRLAHRPSPGLAQGSFHPSPAPGGGWIRSSEWIEDRAMTGGAAASPARTPT